jgi:hypothetical protein
MILILHGDEFGPAVLVGDVLEADELIGIHGRRTNVSDFAHFDEIND